MRTKRRSTWPAIALAVLLGIAVGATLDLAASAAAAADAAPGTRGCVALMHASSVQAQARVRPSASHRLSQSILWCAAMPAPAVACSGCASLGFTSPVTSRQRLATLTVLRI